MILGRLAALLAATFPVTASAQLAGSTPRENVGPTAREILDGYVAEALRSNLSLSAQRSMARRAASAVREARGRMLPTVGVNARYSQYSGVINIGDFINPAYTALNGLLGEARFPTDINATLPFRQETKLEFVQPLFAPALRAATDAASAQQDIAGAATAGMAARVAAETQLAWLGYATGERVVETLEAALGVLDENLRISERLVSAGSATPDVVLRARAERSDVLQQIAEARQRRDAARRAFNRLRDKDGDAPVALAADSTLLPADTLSLAALEASALANRDELRQADGGIRLSNAGRRAAASAFLPTVALSASYGVQGDRYRFDRGNDVAIASLVLSWNLLNGGQDDARRQQAGMLRDEAAIRRREAEQAVRLDVRNAFDALGAARVAMTAASDRLASAARAFTLVERRYGEGLATGIEFLSARSAYTAAALNDVITRYSVAARAVDLERAAATRRFPQ